MWELELVADLQKEMKPHSKKHQQALTNVLVNLETFLDAMNAGAHPQTVQRSFIHAEPRGVLAITESGPGKGLMPFRLYVYPDPEVKKLFVLRLGTKTRTKSEQSGDIKNCSDWVIQYLKKNKPRSKECLNEDEGKRDQ